MSVGPQGPSGEPGLEVKGRSYNRLLPTLFISFLSDASLVTYIVNCVAHQDCFDQTRDGFRSDAGCDSEIWTLAFVARFQIGQILRNSGEAGIQRPEQNQYENQPARRED